MKAMTVRGLDETTMDALKKRAEQDGASINTTLLRILKKELGIDRKKHTTVYHDLDDLAGTWDKKEYSQFQKNIEDFEKIDEALWK